MNKKIYKVIKTPCFDGDINSMVLFANNEKEAKEMYINAYHRIKKLPISEEYIIQTIELGNVSKKLQKAETIHSMLLDVFDITYEKEEIIKY